MPDGEIGRIDDDTSFRIQRSRGAETDGRNLILQGSVTEKPLNRCRNRGEAVGWRARGQHRSPALGENLAFSIHQTGRDFGSTDVYSNDDAGLIFHVMRNQACCLRTLVKERLVDTPCSCALTLLPSISSMTLVCEVSRVGLPSS